jgi:hypothetical protein
MKSRHLCPTLFILLASTTTSWAAATAEQAADILKSFQTYMGTEADVVTVTPDGEGYEITLDPAPYLKKITTPGFTSAVDPYSFKVTPKGDGQWSVTTDGPYKATASVPGTMSFDLSIANMEMEGTYDESLFAFTDSTSTMTKLTLAQTNSDPTTNLSTSTSTVVDLISSTSTGTEGEAGTVDSESEVQITGVVTSTKAEVPPEMAGMSPFLNYSANLAKGSYTSNFKGLAARPIMELIAWGFEHPTKELALKDQAQLKEKLLAALPLFASLESSGTFEDIKIDSDRIPITIATAGSYVKMNGAVKTGKAGEGINITGFKMPDNLLPPWTKGLVPSTVKFGFEVNDFDAETPVRKFITEMDVSATDPVPPGSEAAYMAAFAPKNSIQLELPSGEISSDLYSLTFESTSTINFAGLPTVSAKIHMKGMEAVIAQLQQAATEPMAQQGMAMLFAAKGVSKPEGEGVVWDISVSPDGKALVNGTDLSAMLGGLSGQPPAQ